MDPEAWLALMPGGPAEAMSGALKARLQQRLDAARKSLERAQAVGPGIHAARLGALRDQLRQRRLSGFVVPKTDAHQSENLPGCAERLAWLTGFSGSAGSAVVLRDRAALFVDGRYTLQAAAQVDAGLFEVCHVTGDTMAAWIAQHLGKGARLGFDPWLHSVHQAATLHEACASSGARLVAVDANPIDAIWSDRPAAPLAPAFCHDEAFAGLGARDKLRHVAALLAEAGDDSVILTSTDSIAWLLNIRGGDVPFAPLLLAFAIVHADATAQVFTDPRKLVDGVRDRLGDAVTFASFDAFSAALDRLGSGGGQIRVDRDSAPDAVATSLRKAGARLRYDADPCLLPKAKKNPVELAGIRAAHRRDGAALCRFLAWLEAAAGSGDVTEIAAADRLESLRGENTHYRGPSFPTIAGADANGAIVHYRANAASNRTLKPGSLFLLDSGGQYLDGTTDVTRTVAVGEPTAEMRSRFTLVLKGHIAIATARFPRGTTGSQLDALARRALWAECLDYDHGTGHGVGHYLCVHEGPQRISKLPSRVALESGMVVSNEPGFYQASSFGIRIENLVAVVPLADVCDGNGKGRFLNFETLTLAPIDQALIDPSLLDAAERDWLDAYHARVMETIAPLVDAATARWLTVATRPLPV
ncbi:MAG: aminopeptidase P family protein [Rhodospirillales bacterium]|nr:aminopeptidase P family protein [Rhodospirillales bacterium]